MPHFRYLLDVEGGLLETAPDVATHIRQLGAAMRDDAAMQTRRRRFVKAFVRPDGLDVAATPRFADALERTARRLGRRPALQRTSISTRIVARVSVAANHGIGRWLLMDAGDIEKAQRDRATDEARRQRAATQDAWRARKQRERDAHLRRTEEERERKRLRLLERERAKVAARDEQQRLDEEQARRKRRVQRWRQWRYRLGTMTPVTILKRGLRR
jgi:hypothetical protein